MTSLLLMPCLGRAKRRIGARMGSVSLQGEGQQNLLCGALSAALLVGLAANGVLGLWWLDPVAGLMIAGVALKEGFETWRGEGCCALVATDDEDCCHTAVPAGSSGEGLTMDLADAREAGSPPGWRAIRPTRARGELVGSRHWPRSEA